MTNPLLSLSFDIAFDQITPAHVEPAIDTLIAQAEASVTAVRMNTEPPTYDNTLGALEASTIALELASNVVGHVEAVATSDAMREAYNQARPKVSAFFSALSMNSDVYARIKAFSETDEASSLEPTRARFLKKSLDEFRRQGADLGGEDKAALERISDELTKKTTAFAQNVLDATNAWELVITDEAQLAGLPPSARDAARQSASSQDKEGWRFTLHAPSLLPLLTHLDDAAIRERAWRAYYTRAAEPNEALIVEILRLRAEKAALLGYQNFADLVLESRMAKTGARAREFVDDLQERTREAFVQETAALAEFAQKALDPWDVGYYAEKLRKARFDFDSEALRPYFGADRVLAGLFGIVERLYQVKIEERQMPAWHEDVRSFAIVGNDGRHVASFYADLYPRESKRGGAWMNQIITGLDGDPQLGLFCANVTPPIGDAPALLTHREVETLFHEFGHLLHHALTDVSVRSLAGTNVAWDFVELPSQIMENWCWEREALDMFARHYETDAPIPDALFDKMTAARTFRAASAQMRQLGFSSIDLLLHTEYDPERDGSLVAYARNQMEPFSTTSNPDDFAMICSFSHLFGAPVGYAAGYYSYKWAEVLDADAFTRFAKEGITNPEVGAAFRSTILSRGDSDDPAELYRAFMGRDPDLNALLERNGLV